MPRDSFPVKKVWPEIADAWDDSFWDYITNDKIEFLRLKVAPLLRFAANVDVAAETFTSKVERLKLQLLRGKPSPATLTSVAEDVSRLPDFIATRGYITISEDGQQVYVAEYRKRIEERILQIVANHPTLEAIRQGE